MIFLSYFDSAGLSELLEQLDKELQQHQWKLFYKNLRKISKNLDFSFPKWFFFSDLRPLTKIQKPFFSNFLFEKCRAASGVYYGF